MLKAADPELVHKSDVGGVRLNLADADAVRAAYRGDRRGRRAGPDVLVQPMVSGSVELVAGIVHDPLFGSLVMLGARRGAHRPARRPRPAAGPDDRPGRRPDVAVAARRAAADRLPGQRRRSTPPRVEDLLLRLGRLAEDLPEIAELDLNPVLAGPDGVVAVDAKLRLAPVGAEPDPTLRRLRDPS